MRAAIGSGALVFLSLSLLQLASSQRADECTVWEDQGISNLEFLNENFAETSRQSEEGPLFTTNSMTCCDACFDDVECIMAFFSLGPESATCARFKFLDEPISLSSDALLNATTELAGSSIIWTYEEPTLEPTSEPTLEPPSASTAVATETNSTAGTEPPTVEGPGDESEGEGEGEGEEEDDEDVLGIPDQTLYIVLGSAGGLCVLCAFGMCCYCLGQADTRGDRKPRYRRHKRRVPVSSV